MRNWINNRRNQISIILAAVIILAISNFILPAYETLSYYQLKSISLEKQERQLYGYSLHIDYHEKQSGRIQQQLAKLQQVFSQAENTAILQKKLGNLQRKYHLKVASQVIQKGKPSQDLQVMRIEQTLDGIYKDHMRYLEAVLDRDNNLLLERYELTSQEPFDNNPLLTAKLQLTLFLPVQ